MPMNCCAATMGPTYLIAAVSVVSRVCFETEMASHTSKIEYVECLVSYIRCTHAHYAYTYVGIANAYTHNTHNMHIHTICIYVHDVCIHTQAYTVHTHHAHTRSNVCVDGVCMCMYAQTIHTHIVCVCVLCVPVWAEAEWVWQVCHSEGQKFVVVLSFVTSLVILGNH